MTNTEPLRAGMFQSLEEASGMRSNYRPFHPAIGADARAERLSGWRKVIGSVEHLTQTTKGCPC